MKISDNPIKKSLRDIIVSEENVYNAIYCMESYVFEKGLLDENDLELYNALHDKVNFNMIPAKVTCNPFQQYGIV